jgi:hypothetical protein
MRSRRKIKLSDVSICHLPRPTRTIFERIVDLNCVVGGDTVSSDFRTLWSAKERFYIARAAPAANQRTESSSIEVIGRRLDDVTRRRG